MYVLGRIPEVARRRCFYHRSSHVFFVPPQCYAMKCNSRKKVDREELLISPF
jgi:hypothetical protein